MHPEYEALQAQLHRANEILRHTCDWLNDAAFGPSLAQLRREVLGYFGLEAGEPWLVQATERTLGPQAVAVLNPQAGGAVRTDVFPTVLAHHGPLAGDVVVMDATSSTGKRWMPSGAEVT